jgi:hypothetical protein
MEIPTPTNGKKSQSTASGESKAVVDSIVIATSEWRVAVRPHHGEGGIATREHFASGSVTSVPAEICNDFIDDDDWMSPVPNAIGSLGKTTPIARFESILATQGGSVGDFTTVYNPGMPELDTDSDDPEMEDTTDDDDDDMPSLEDPGPDPDDRALYIGSADAFHETGSAADLVVQLGFPQK